MLKIKGILKKVYEPSRGLSDGKAWSSIDFVMQEDGPYPKMVKMKAWNDVAEKIAVSSIGDVVEVNLIISSREFKGKWYTDVTATQFFNHFA